MKRNQNIEIYRIWCIFFIMVGHIGGYYSIEGGTEFNRHVLRYTGALGVFGVDAFVLISGYFLVNARMKIERVVRVFIETTFYMFIFTLIARLFGRAEVGWNEVVKSAFILGPTKYSVWFITNYLALMLLQPVLSRIATSLTKREYQLLLCVLLILTTEFVKGVFPWGYKFAGGFSLTWFISLFFFAGYIRLYGLGDNGNKSLMWGLIFGGSMIMWAVFTEFPWINLNYQSPVTLMSAISGFMFFKSLDGELMSKLPVQSVSKHILSCYVIHQHPWVIPVIVLVFAPMLPSNVSPWLWPSLLAMGALTFIACVVMDKVRMWLFRVCGIYTLISKVSTWMDDAVKGWLLRA